MKPASNTVPDLPPGLRTPRLYNLVKHISGFDRLVAELHEQYGDICFYRMPIVNYCILHNLELMHEVLTVKLPDPRDPDGPPVQVFGKLNPMDYLGRVTKSIFVDNTWGLNGSDNAWHDRLLTLMAPGLLDDKYLEAYSAQIIENIRVLHTRWKPGEVIHLWNELKEFQAHCVIRMNLGTAVDAIPPSVVVDTSEGYKQEVILSMFPGTPLLRKLPLPKSRSSKRSAREVSALIYQTIERIRDGSHDPYCMASRLIEANRLEEREELLSDQEVHDVLFENITIPIDPELITLTKAVGRVVYYPEVRRRLQEEVDEVIGYRPIRVGDYDKLRYATAIMQETLRVSPPAPVLNRVTTRDYVLGGYRIPKGTMVMCVLAAHHRDPRYWDSPDEFRPERWLEDPQPQRPTHAYMPFGYGARECTGREFAMRAGVYFLASTFQRLRLDTVKPGLIEERSSPLFLLSMVKGTVPMMVRERTDGTRV